MPGRFDGRMPPLAASSIPSRRPHPTAPAPPVLLRSRPGERRLRLAETRAGDPVAGPSWAAVATISCRRATRDRAETVMRDLRSQYPAVASFRLSSAPWNWVSSDRWSCAPQGPGSRSVGAPTKLRPNDDLSRASRLPPIADLSTCDLIARKTSRETVRSPASASSATASARSGGTRAAIVTRCSGFTALTSPML